MPTRASICLVLALLAGTLGAWENDYLQVRWVLDEHGEANALRVKLVNRRFKSLDRVFDVKVEDASNGKLVPRSRLSADARRNASLQTELRAFWVAVKRTLVVEETAFRTGTDAWDRKAIYILTFDSKGKPQIGTDAFDNLFVDPKGKLWRYALRDPMAQTGDPFEGWFRLCPDESNRSKPSNCDWQAKEMKPDWIDGLSSAREEL